MSDFRALESGRGVVQCDLCLRELEVRFQRNGSRRREGDALLAQRYGQGEAVEF